MPNRWLFCNISELLLKKSIFLPVKLENCKGNLTLVYGKIQYGDKKLSIKAVFFSKHLPVIANFMDCYNLSVEGSWFFLKNKPASQKLVLFNKLTHFFRNQCKLIRECHFLRLASRNAFLVWKKRANLHFCKICFGNQNKWLNFLHQEDLSQPLSISAGSINYTIWGSFAPIGNFTDQNGHKVVFFSLFPENQTLCSPKLLAVIQSSGYNRHPSTCKMAFIALQWKPLGPN